VGKYFSCNTYLIAKTNVLVVGNLPAETISVWSTGMGL